MTFFSLQRQSLNMVIFWTILVQRTRQIEVGVSTGVQRTTDG